MEKINNRLENMLQFQRKRRKLQAEQQNCSEEKATYDCLSPEQKRIVLAIGALSSITDENLHINLTELKQTWQSWETPAEKVLDELQYSDIVICNAPNNYDMSSFGRGVCKELTDVQTSLQHVL